MRRLVIGDIHSGLKALHQVLERAEITKNDHLIFLGDYVDGWSAAFETVSYLITLKNTHNCTFIRGNHDELCYKWMTTGEANPQWLAHGGHATRASYLIAGKDKWKSHLEFYEQLENTFVDENNRLYLHAGFTNLKGIEFEYFDQLFYWDRTLWELARAIDPNMTPQDANYPKRLIHYKEIFIGHTPISKIDIAVPKKAANVWNVDTGAGFKGPLTIMEVGNNVFWQSDPVHELYKGEAGRNP
ncbi:MAG: serine/threonine protein phosphatase [Croceitalea sp.]|nr:serine/threonine protein phosphatase [Croceitalea sp.]